MKRNAYLLPLGLAWLVACQSSSPEKQEAIALSRTAATESFQEAPKDIEIGLTEETEEAEETQSIAVADPASEPFKEVSQEPIVGDSGGVENLVSHPSVTLRRGESLAHFARWSGTPVEEIAEVSGLSLDDTYPVGLEIVLPITEQALVDVEAAREAHRVKRVEGYLASRGGGDKSDFYKVKTGDTAWSIAKNQQGIPIWVLESYNPAIDLDRLRPGQELMVPVLTDIVVDAE
jgi:LysM repeat protein